MQDNAQASQLVADTVRNLATVTNMPKRTRLLLVLLGLSAMLYIAVQVDWSVPGRYYRNYQHVQAMLARKDQLDSAVARLRARYGESANMSFAVSFDLQGTFTQVVQVTRECGELDDHSFLDDARQLFKEAGLGRIDRLEYRYGCDQPLSFGMTAQAFNQSFISALKEHSWCREITPSQALSQARLDQPSQLWTDKNAAIQAQLDSDGDGSITRGRWYSALAPLNDGQAQYRMMLCATRAVIRVLEPGLDEAQVFKLNSEVHSEGPDSQAVEVGRYRFSGSARPMGFNVSRVRKD